MRARLSPAFSPLALIPFPSAVSDGLHGCRQLIGRHGGEKTAVRSGGRVRLSVAGRGENTDLAEEDGLPVSNGQREALITGGSEIPFFFGFVLSEETFVGGVNFPS